MSKNARLKIHCIINIWENLNLKYLVFFFNEAHDTVPGSIKYLLEVGYFGMLEEINSASII